jgi:hypothetical protein
MLKSRFDIFFSLSDFSPLVSSPPPESVLEPSLLQARRDIKAKQKNNFFIFSILQNPCLEIIKSSERKFVSKT